MHSVEINEDSSTLEFYESDFAFVYLDVDDPHVAWLAYRGLLNSCDIATANPGNISLFFVDVIKRGLVSTLRREGLLEGSRLREFPNLPSRFKCIYAYPTLDAAASGNFGRGSFGRRIWSRSHLLGTISGRLHTTQNGSPTSIHFPQILPGNIGLVKPPRNPISSIS
jgi:Protein of unknown function (DUF2441)